MSKPILRLKGKIQHYAWGGTTFLPGLLHIENADGRPCAEYWLGVHPSAPAMVEVDGAALPLSELIKNNPNEYIGTAVHQLFGELPYLLKVLDVKDMLSIQVHPTKEEAKKGFEAEEAAGIPVDAPHRNYKDSNHKPEVMVALSPFYLLHGFKPDQKLRETLTNTPGFEALLPVYNSGGYKGLYRHVMEMPQADVDSLLLPLVAHEINNPADKSLPGYWVAKLYGGGAPAGDIDRGIFSIYFFNIVHLQPGEAIFQGAGIPHAYLEGQNIELMANSDNVLRGGLTPKHIDLAELMKHTLFEAVEPKVMQGNEMNPVETFYPCPVPDFAISAIRLNGQLYQKTSLSAEIYLVVKGEVSVGNQGRWSSGEAFYARPGTEVNLVGDGALLYKAFVPNIM